MAITADFSVVCPADTRSAQIVWREINERVDEEVTRVRAEGWKIDNASFTMRGPSEFASFYVVSFSARRAPS